MSSGNSIFPSVFTLEDRDNFIDQCVEDWSKKFGLDPDLLGIGLNAEDHDLQAVYTLGNVDVGNEQTPLVVDVVAASLRTDANTPGPRAAGPTDNPTVPQPSWITSTSPDPKLDGKPLADTVAVLIGAIAIRVDIPPVTIVAGRPTTISGGSYVIDAQIADALHGVQQAFDASMLELRNAERLISRASGMMTTSYGSSRVALVTPTVEVGEATVEPIYSGQVLTRDRGWKKLSTAFILGDQELLHIKHTIPRSTAWPLLGAEVGLPYQRRMRVTVSFPGSIVVRRSTGAGVGGIPRRKIGSGNNC